MSYCGGPSPVGSNVAGNIRFMQAPNNPVIGSPSTGNNSADGASIIDDRLLLERKISKVQEKADYFWQQC